LTVPLLKAGFILISPGEGFSLPVHPSTEKKPQIKM